MEPGRFAENVRRLAGMHLVSVDALAEHVGMTRPGLMKALASSGASRSLPRSENAARIAEAFNVDVRDLFGEPLACLRAAVDGFETAPIRARAKVPETITVGMVEPVARDARVNVVRLRGKGAGRRRTEPK